VVKSAALTLLVCFSFQAKAQQDSTAVWEEIINLESRIQADFPQTFAKANQLLGQVKSLNCETCLGRALMMVGKFHWANGQYPEGLSYFRQSILISSRIGDHDTWSKATDLIANTYYYQAYYDSAEFYFQKALELAQQVNDWEGMVMILHNTSLMYHRKGDFRKTIEYIFKGEEVKDRVPRSEHQIEAMGAMGSLMIDSLYYKEEIEDELRNVAHFQREKNLKGLYSTYRNLGKAYRQLEMYQIAARYFVKASLVMNELQLIPEWDLAATDYRDANMRDSCFYYHYLAKNDMKRTTMPNAAYTIELLGDAHLFFNQPDSALLYYDSAINMNYRMNNRITFTGIHRNLVRVHALLGNYDKAEYHLKKGLRLAKQVALIHEKNLLNEGKFLYEKMGDYRSALFYSEKFKAYLDSINRQETAINLTRMQAEFKTTKKESELNSLKQLNLLNEEKIKAQTLQVILALVSLILIGSLGGFYYSRFRQKKKASDLLERKNQIIEQQYDVVKKQNDDKEALLHEIHHRVKNNLQIISSLINLKSKNASNETKEILGDLNSRIHSLGLIHEMLYKSDSLGLIDLKEYLSEQCKLTVASLEGDGILLDVELDQLDTGIDTAITFGLITNELITNAIKYAFDKSQEVKKIMVSLRNVDGHWVFKISDNGRKLALDEGIVKSFGLRFVEQLVKNKLNGEMNIDYQNGLRVEIVLNSQAANLVSETV